jgi:Putative zinc-finger
MTCPTYYPGLSRLLDGELGPSEQHDVEQHLFRCEDCRRTLDNWRLQGLLVRDFFRRHSVGDDFVLKVRQSNRNVAEPVARSWLGTDLLTWLQVAAVVLIVILVTTFLFLPGESLSLAEVLHPGERLDLLGADSESWMPREAGARLHKGDWLRNVRISPVQILLRDSSRVTLEQGTLAQLQGSSRDLGNQLFLARGSMISDPYDARRSFQVGTPAGEITGSGASFGVSVRTLTLPTLAIGTDKSELLRGSVFPLTAVRVKQGNIQVENRSIHRMVSAGNAAIFTPSLFAAGPAAPNFTGITTELWADAQSGPGSGVLSSSLVPTKEGAEIAFEAEHVPLTRLLESTTGSPVRGDNNLKVNGRLAYPLDTPGDALVSAIGRSLGLELAIREKLSRQQTALLTEPGPLTSTDRAAGEFVIQRSPQGTISFDFKDVNADEVFRSLRAQQIDLPELALISEDVPITIKATDLKPEEVLSWLKERLRITLSEQEELVQVVEVVSAARSDEQSSAGLPVPNPLLQQKLFFPTGSGTGPSWSATPAAPVAGATVGERSLWSIINEGAVSQPLGKAPVVIRETEPAAAAKTANRPAEASEEEWLVQEPQSSGHLVWPAISSGASGLEEIYFLAQPSGEERETIWLGYDSNGQLAARVTLEIARSLVAVLPSRDLHFQIGDGGHWETLSDTPLAGSMATRIDWNRFDTLYDAVDAGRLSDYWDFEAPMAGSRLFIVNPGEQSVDVVLALVRENRILGAEEIFLPPHGSLMWSGHLQIPELYSGARLILKSLNGRVAAGTARR